MKPLPLLSPDLIFRGAIFCCLLTASANAQTVFERYYGDPATGDEGTSIITTADGNLAVLGHTLNGAFGDYDLYFLKINPAGDTLWTRTYGGSRKDMPADVVQTSDGGFMLLGTTVSFGAGKEDVLLLRTDAQGKLLWQKTFGTEASDQAVQLVARENNTYILAYNRYVSFSNKNAVLLKLNSHGALLNEEFNSTRMLDAVVRTTEGNLVMAEQGGYLTKLDTDWTVQWSKQISIGLTDLSPTANGGVVLRSEHNGYDQKVVRVEKDGYIAWTRAFVFYQPPGYSSSYNKTNHVLEQSNGRVVFLNNYTSPTDKKRRLALYSLDGTNGAVLSTTPYTHAEVAHTAGYKMLEDAQKNLYVVGMRHENGPDLLVYKTNPELQEIWFKTYGKPGPLGYDIVSHHVPTSDGGYLLCGSKGPSHTPQGILTDLWYFKVDAAGDVVWEKTLGAPDTNEVGYKALATADGGFLLMGEKHYYAWLVKTDAGGNVLWQRQFAGNLNFGSSGMFSGGGHGNLLQTPDGGYILSINGIGSSMDIIKINAGGQILWSKQVGSLVFGTDLCQTPDGNFLLGGSHVTKINQQGTALWQHDFSTTTQYDMVDILADGNYVATGITKENNNTSIACAIKISPDGDSLTGLKFAGPGNTPLTMINDIVPVGDGGFVIVGAASNSDGGYLVRVDAGNNIVWERHVNQENQTRLYSGSVTSDGGMAFAGIALNNTLYDGYFIKTNADGLVVSTLDPAVKNQAGTLLCLPNPATQETRVQYSGPETGLLRYSLLDVQGRVVHQGATQKTEPDHFFRLNLENLPPGVYVVQTRTSAGLAATKLIKQ